MGATGVAGTHAAAEFAKSHTVVTAARSGADLCFDATDFSALESAISEARPEAVINAAKPSMGADQMEHEREKAYLLNTALPEGLAVLSAKCGFKLVHMSTDWVYEGREGVIYEEASPAHPLNYYSQTKLEAEGKVLAASPRSLVLRPEGIFGLDRRGSNLYMRLKNAGKEGKEVAVASDQFSQPICGAELARITRVLLEKGASGIYNVVGPDYLSRAEFARRTCEYFGFSAVLREYSARDRPLAVPMCLRVSTAKAEGAAGRIKSLREQFAELKEMEEMRHAN